MIRFDQKRVMQQLTQVGWYGYSKDYSQYIMPIDEFVNLVTAAVIPVNQEMEVV